MSEKIIYPARELPSRTPLPARMAAVSKGQATWPEPLLNARCFECVFFDQGKDVVSDSGKAKGLGRCRRVAQLKGGHWGYQLEGRSIACSEFGVEA